MINITSSLIDKYDISFQGGSRIFTDGSNPAFMKALKKSVHEDTDYEQAITTIKRNTPGQKESAAIRNNMFVIPIAFSKYHKEMLAHCKEIMENHNGMIAIHPDKGKLITALRTAVENGEGGLDKDATSYDDLFDAFRMSLLFWH